MKLKTIVIAFILSGTLVITASAETNYIPENGANTASVSESTVYDVPQTTSEGEVKNGQVTSSSKLAGGVGEKSQVDGLFETGEFNKKTPQSVEAGNQVRNLVMEIVSFLVSIFPSVVILQTVIDIACMLVKPIAVFFSTHFPFQLFTDECATVTGIPYVGKGGQANTGGAASTDGKKDNGYGYYFRKRVLLIVFCAVLLGVCASGQFIAFLNLIIMLFQWVYNGVANKL